jgi:hypothetical protein
MHVRGRAVQADMGSAGRPHTLLRLLTTERNADVWLEHGNICVFAIGVRKEEHM